VLAGASWFWEYRVARASATPDPWDNDMVVPFDRRH